GTFGTELFDPFGERVRRAVRGKYLGFVGHGKIGELLCRLAHHLPIARASHDDADKRRAASHFFIPPRGTQSDGEGLRGTCRKSLRSLPPGAVAQAVSCSNPGFPGSRARIACRMTGGSNRVGTGRRARSARNPR